ncbi:unnamed protein product [Clonostachys rosea]|uniref:Casein kinase II beta 2 subunit n=1 Tax=Bionectria ochroleuca TaxID=29856 RepID=A0ABY6TPN4_BIOOC|nr:unnamed protein product [Clonostachys rosea]
MASVGTAWGPPTLRLLRFAVAKTAKAVHASVVQAVRPLKGQLHLIPIRNGLARRHPIHPTAILKQQRRFSSRLARSAARKVENVARRYFSSQPSAARSHGIDRSKIPSSNTLRRVAQFSGRAPFATTLRPNLTGGALPRTAGGYSLGGGARYFSHTPAAPAQVVQNVSQAMRGFLLSGQKLRYDGLNSRGERQYRAVSGLEDDAMNKLAAIPKFTPGSFIDFKLSPTLTALSPLAAAITQVSELSGFKAEAIVSPTNLNTEGFLDVLSSDFGRALQDLTTIYADLRRLSILGDLPITQEGNGSIRVRFPGVDAETVCRLCDDIGIQRGVVRQDPDFDLSAGVPVALRFPFAPDAEKTLTSPGGSARSLTGHEIEEISLFDDDSFINEAFVIEEIAENPWLSEPEGYESLSPPMSTADHCSTEFEGVQGIYRFIEECDRARARVR